MKLAKQPDINRQLTWLERPKPAILNCFQILNFYTRIILFITPVLMFNFFTFFALSWKINKCTNELLLAITLNVPESMHVSFVILSTCQICRLPDTITVINKDQKMKLCGQTCTVSKGKPFKLVFNIQYFSYMTYLLIASFYILTYIFI